MIGPMTPLDAEFATGVPARTIRRWALLGRVVDHGDGQRILVDPEEVLQLSDLRAKRAGCRLPNREIVA